MNTKITTEIAINAAGNYFYEQDSFELEAGGSLSITGTGDVNLYLYGCNGKCYINNTKSSGTLNAYIYGYSGWLELRGAGGTSNFRIYGINGSVGHSGTISILQIEGGNYRIQGAATISTLSRYGNVEDIKTKTDQLTFTNANKVDAASLITTAPTDMALDSTVAKEASLLDAQDIRDAMKLAPSSGDPASGSVDAELDSLYDSAGLLLTDTNTIKGDVDDIPYINGGVIDIKAKTDQLTFTNANKVDAASLITTAPTDMALDSTVAKDATVAKAAGEKGTDAIKDALFVVDQTCNGLNMVLDSMTATVGATDDKCTEIKSKTDQLPTNFQTVIDALIVIQAAIESGMDKIVLRDNLRLIMSKLDTTKTNQIIDK